METSSIRTLDFNDWMLGDPFSKARFVRDVRECCTHPGFFNLANHGIPQPGIDLVRDHMKELYLGHTIEELMQYYFPKLDGQLGYTPLDTEKALGAKLADHKHFIMFGDTYPLPEIKEVPGLRASSLALFNHYNVLYREFMKVVALSLDLPADYFTASLGNSSLRLIHYPKTNRPATGDDAGIANVEKGGNVIGKCNEPHTDIDMYTFLHSQQAGLQLWDGRRWIPVPVSRETLVVNCGDMIEHLTNGLYVSGSHRVICPPDVDRFSIPCFQHVLGDTSIVPLAHLGPPDLKRFPHQKALPFLLKRLEDINVRNKVISAIKLSDASKN